MSESVIAAAAWKVGSARLNGGRPLLVRATDDRRALEVSCDGYSEQVVAPVEDREELVLSH